MKKFYLFIIIFLVIISTIIFGLNYNSNNPVKDNEFMKYPYYKDNNLKRYINYKKKNKDLSNSSIVIRVNLNLDKNDYSNISLSKYENRNYILINKHIHLKNNYIPDNIEYLDLKYARNGMMLVHDAKVNVEKMIDDALKDNIKIRVISSYRSYYYQAKLYNNYVISDGKEKADTYSARPGFSEHQTGLSIDVDDTITYYNDFENTEAFKWMINNSYKYGFILRYPKGKEDITRYNYESWHYRYVGKEISKYIKKHNITLDEYYAMFIDN